MITTTKYPKSIKSPVLAKNVLKPGSNNTKLGFVVKSHMWKDARLFSLTLTERTTCPTSCHHWEDCYGNNMPFAHRFDTNLLPDKLEAEVAELCAKYPKGVVIRLHVLGDFYSVDYVKFWRDMLAKYDNLHVFGYTAHLPETEMGDLIFWLNYDFPSRCMIRYSANRNSDYDPNYQRFAAEEGFEGKSFDCPEQIGKVKSCAACGLCWMSPRTVRFVSH